MSKAIFLTHKQRLFIKNYLSGMNGTDAAMNAYNVSNRATAAVIASENLIKPNILEIINALSPKGFILENSIRVIGEGMRATKGVNQLPNHSIRLRASDMGLRLLEHVSGEKLW